MALDQELRRIAEVAVTYCRDGEETGWLVLDGEGSPVEDRTLVREAVSIAALYELAEEAVGSSDDEPRVATPAQLDALGSSQNVVEAIKQGTGTIDELLRDVERGYKAALH